MFHDHHEMEDSWYFPILSKAVSLELIEGEHALFGTPLHALEEYLLSCLPGGTLWDGGRKAVPQNSPNSTFESAKLLGLIDELVPSFVPHVSEFLLAMILFGISGAGVLFNSAHRAHVVLLSDSSVLRSGI